MVSRITDKSVKALPPSSRHLEVIFDTDTKGFGIRVTAKGAKAFVLRYRNSRGQQRQLKIGNFPDWSVAAAREQANRLKQQIDLGVDPLDVRLADKAAPTLTDLWEYYRTTHLSYKASHGQLNETSMALKIILPAFGDMRVADFKPSDADSLHQHITKKTPIRANRVLDFLRRLMSIAVRLEWRANNPVSGYKRNPENKRTRYLTEIEASDLLRVLAAHPEKRSADALKFLLLTGARKSEALRAEWSQIDFVACRWTKPASYTKQRKMHQVPLSQEAIELLQEIAAASESKFVFTSDCGTKPIQDVKRTWASACKTAKLENLRIHDLRHSYVSFLANAGVSQTTAGALVGHSSPATTARYTHLFDATLREANSKVGNLIRGLSHTKPTIAAA